MKFYKAKCLKIVLGAIVLTLLSLFYVDSDNITCGLPVDFPGGCENIIVSGFPFVMVEDDVSLSPRNNLGIEDIINYGNIFGNIIFYIGVLSLINFMYELK